VVTARTLQVQCAVEGKIQSELCKCLYEACIYIRVWEKKRGWGGGRTYTGRFAKHDHPNFFFLSKINLFESGFSEFLNTLKRSRIECLNINLCKKIRTSSFSVIKTFVLRIMRP